MATDQLELRLTRLERINRILVSFIIIMVVVLGFEFTRAEFTKTVSVPDNLVVKSLQIRGGADIPAMTLTPYGLSVRDRTAYERIALRLSTNGAPDKDHPIGEFRIQDSKNENGFVVYQGPSDSEFSLTWETKGWPDRTIGGDIGADFGFLKVEGPRPADPWLLLQAAKGTAVMSVGQFPTKNGEIQNGTDSVENLGLGFDEGKSYINVNHRYDKKPGADVHL